MSAQAIDLSCLGPTRRRRCQSDLGGRWTPHGSAVTLTTEAAFVDRFFAQEVAPIQASRVVSPERFNHIEHQAALHESGCQPRRNFSHIPRCLPQSISAASGRSGVCGLDLGRDFQRLSGPGGR